METKKVYLHATVASGCQSQMLELEDVTMNELGVRGYKGRRETNSRLLYTIPWTSIRYVTQADDANEPF